MSCVAGRGGGAANRAAGQRGACHMWRRRLHVARRGEKRRGEKGERGGEMCERRGEKARFESPDGPPRQADVCCWCDGMHAAAAGAVNAPSDTACRTRKRRPIVWKT